MKKMSPMPAILLALLSAACNSQPASSVSGPAPASGPGSGSSPSKKLDPYIMVRINGGTFTMGSPASEPERDKDEVQHSVTVSSFYIGKYEVTQKQWEDIMFPSRTDSLRGFFNDKDRKYNYDLGLRSRTIEINDPMCLVTWYEVIEYCNKRSQREGLTPVYTINKDNWDDSNTSNFDNVHWTVTWDRNANGYRLPTEAEWEYACRAGTTTPFHTGRNITTSQANYDGYYPYNNGPKGSARRSTWTIGSGASNAWGLYDMHGNVWEWCWDWYGPYSTNSQTDPIGAGSGSGRVFRGGGCVDWGSKVSPEPGAKHLRSAFRGYSNPTYITKVLGFRLARNAE